MFKHFTDKSVAADMQVHVEHGKPLTFGKDGEKGLRMKAGLAELEVVTIGENGVTAALSKWMSYLTLPLRWLNLGLA